MKICVFSNSHAAALQLGFELLSEDLSHQVDVTFFASRQNRLGHLSYRSGELICEDADISADLKFTSGGLTSVALNDYDAFIVHALGYRFHYRPFLDGFVTDSFIREYALQRWDSSVNRHLVDLLAAHSSKPILVSRQPYWSSADQELRPMVRQSPVNLGAQIDAVRSLIQEQYLRVHVVEQAIDTVIHDYLTRTKFSRNSKRLDVGDKQSGKPHPEHDHQHMNAAYGQSMWQEYLRTLKVEADDMLALGN